MNLIFSKKLAALRRERGVSQRAVAAELNISQALLSHYEKGIREPGLEFVSRVCDYYGVSADYLLGRSRLKDGAVSYSGPAGKEQTLSCKRSLQSSIGLLFEALEKDEALLLSAYHCISADVYLLLRRICEKTESESDMFSLDACDIGEYAAAERALSLLRFATAAKEQPTLTKAALKATAPSSFDTLTELIQTIEARIKADTGVQE